MNSKKYISRKDFANCPIWRYDEDRDFYTPVMAPQELPESQRNVEIRTEFIAKDGTHLMGYIVGIQDIFSIGIFVDDELIAFFNMNLTSLVDKEFKKLKPLLPETTKGPEDFFPLKFETRFCWQDKGYNDFYGEFDVFERDRKNLKK